MYLTTAAQIKEIDRVTIEEWGIPSTKLMENAAQAVVREILALPAMGSGRKNSAVGWFVGNGGDSFQEERSAIVFSGPGNNGGDGVAVARLLLKEGWRVKCLLVGEREKMSKDCREMERRLESEGGALEEFHAEDWMDYLGFDVAVDALFGVGLNSPLGPDAVEAAKQMKMAGWVVSVDLPSGVQADTGEVLGDAVNADVTVTFSMAKPGLFVGDGAVHSGRVVVADIGIPPEVMDEKACPDLVMERPFLAKRKRNAHKGDFGRLFILAGSRGYTGAAALCARAAVRGGAGLVTVAVPEEIYPIEAVKCCDEAMVWPLPEGDEEVLEKAKGCDGVLIGPGLGRGERARKLVRLLLEKLSCPVIVDADGLNLLSGHIDVLDKREGLTILTPHDGEFAGLTGGELPIRDRMGSASAFAEEHGCILVLKGHRTITAAPGGGCVVNTTGNPGMARGGSGDALAGLMGAMLVQQKDPSAVANAVWLHGRAGDLAATDKGEYGMTVMDLIEAIPDAMKECEEE